MEDRSLTSDSHQYLPLLLLKDLAKSAEANALVTASAGEQTLVSLDHGEILNPDPIVSP